MSFGRGPVVKLREACFFKTVENPRNCGKIRYFYEFSEKVQKWYFGHKNYWKWALFALKEVRIAFLDTFQPGGRLESFQEVHFLGVEGRMPQSCSLTLRIRNPNQIVRLHFMHQNRPKEVIETSICDIECSKSSKIP